MVLKHPVYSIYHKHFITTDYDHVKEVLLFETINKLEVLLDTTATLNKNKNVKIEDKCNHKTLQTTQINKQKKTKEHERYAVSIHPRKIPRNYLNTPYKVFLSISEQVVNLNLNFRSLQFASILGASLH